MATLQRLQLSKVSLVFLVGDLPDIGIHGSAAGCCRRRVWHVLHADIGGHRLLHGVGPLRQHVDVLPACFWTDIRLRIAFWRSDTFQRRAPSCAVALCIGSSMAAER